MSSVWSVQTCLPAIESRQCPCCHQIFDSGEDKTKHQNEVGHFRCVICERRFPDVCSLVKHQFQQATVRSIQDHKTDQRIACPGCEVAYGSASEWLQHIEQNICTGIFKSDLELRQQQLQAFQAALDDRAATAELHFSYTPTDTWAEEPEGPAYNNFQTHGSSVIEQQYTKQEDFPRLPTNQYRVGDSRGLDLLSGDAFNPATKQENAWANRQNSALPQPENAQKRMYNAVPPPRTYSPPALNNGPVGIDDIVGPCKDPYDPRYNPSVFMCQILGKFKCPHLTCGMKTNTAIGMTKHLKSPVHQEEREMCPSCKRTFPGKTALLRHIETAYARCFIRNKGQVREVLRNLTGGILDAKLNIEDENGERREISVDELRGDQMQIFVDPKIAAAVRGNRGGNTVSGGLSSWEGGQFQGRESKFW